MPETTRGSSRWEASRLGAGVGVHLFGGYTVSFAVFLPNFVVPLIVLTDLALATGEGDVDEAAGVSESLLGTALAVDRNPRQSSMLP